MPTAERQQWRDPVTVDAHGGHAAMDYEEHARTYGNFIKGVQISIGALAVLLILMAIFLV